MGSEDLHALLGTLADSQLRAKGLARGRKEGTDQERSIILAGLRRALSMAAAKANSACLLDRVSRVGGAQAGSQEKGLGQEGGGEESLLACQNFLIYPVMHCKF